MLILLLSLGILSTQDIYLHSLLCNLAMTYSPNRYILLLLTQPQLRSRCNKTYDHVLLLIYLRVGYYGLRFLERLYSIGRSRGCCFFCNCSVAMRILASFPRSFCNRNGCLLPNTANNRGAEGLLYIPNRQDFQHGEYLCTSPQ